ncbi:hypothetical protein BOTBODRAFT_57759 [Botryobasidium botryosum FD-172 SS1]|uniref:AB hydrolase-1 domain-containing protein n=1 Tax=Botryobasidium botryosum (strain FD-172 SS1) TaxID=930990 RepID=A0A067M650_BOTB1|nr:hypothetical protein BOTBODRAFT_57759 [Botryobasidium botryosum FD-172 SS1]
MTATKIPVVLLALLHSTLALFIHSKDGTQLWAEAKGDTSKPGVVWLHGYPSSSIVFDEYFEDEDYLSQFHMVRYDIRGMGQSDKPSDPAAYHPERFSEDFDAVVQAFNLHKPCVVGWSSISHDIYEYHGHGYISGFIYMASFHHPAKTGDFTYPERVPMYYKMLDTSNVTAFLEGADEFVDSLLAHPDDIPWKTRMLWTSLVTTVPQSVSYLLLFRDQPGTRLLDEGAPVLPVLYIEAAKDSIINNSAIIETTFRPKFKKLEVLTIPDAGHAAFLHGYKEIKEGIVQFVNKVTKEEEHAGGSPSHIEL